MTSSYNHKTTFYMQVTYIYHCLYTLQGVGHVVLTSRSAEASPIDGPSEQNTAGRVMFQRSISEYASPAKVLGSVEEDDGEDANYRVNTRRRNNSGSVAGHC